MTESRLPSPSETPHPAPEVPMKKKALLPRILLPLLAIGVGAGIFVLLVKTKPEAPKAHRETPAPLVETMVARAAVHEVAVEADGTVLPARKVGIVPQVPGRVVWVSAALQPGGRIREGEVLFRIEDRDYRLAVEAAKAQVAQAELKLRIEERRKALAEREWRRYGRPDGEPPGEGEGDASLALREPQLQTARVAVRSARSALQRAQVNLKRTVVRAPFDAVVLDSKVEVGQVVGPQGGPAATLVATDHFWVQVSVPVGVLPAIRLPRGERAGAEVTVRHHTGTSVVERRGRVIRLLPDLARGGSMARLLVEIDDPLGAPQSEAPPLLLGAFVRVHVEAEPLQGVFELPRAALREGDRLFLVDAEGRLEIRPVRLAWRDERHVYVASGLSEGERVVTGAVPTPVEGMKLRVAEAEPPVAERPNAPAEPKEAVR